MHTKQPVERSPLTEGSLPNKRFDKIDRYVFEPYISNINRLIMIS